MLSTIIQERQSDIRYPDGYLHDDCLNGIRERVQRAEKFVLDPQASAMAASVALSKPSSILKSLIFTKLPADPMWIEFANEDTRTAMARLGSPNRQTESFKVRMERSGYLLSYDGDDIIMEFVHNDRIPQTGRSIADLAPVRGRFVIKDFEFNAALAADLASVLRSDTDPEARDKVKQHLNIITNDPDEAAAAQELRERLHFVPHPDLATVRKNMVRLSGEERTREIESNQAMDMRRLWEMQILPALILLNCRNAVDAEVVPAPGKLNKQRAKKGRPPIPEHRLVKIHLSPSKKRIYAEGGGGGSPMRGGLVIGHFKVRKSGIYWWSPHWRGPVNDTPGERTFVLTR